MVIRRPAVYAAGIAAATLLAALAMPEALLDAADAVGYAVCHRIPERSFYVAGRQLPLCARCTGTFLALGAAFVASAVRGRGSAAILPARRYLLLGAGAILLWAFDGANSYLTLFPGLPHLYEPSNVLRLVTGILAGLAAGLLLLPLFNSVIWARPAPQAVVSRARDLVLPVAAGLGIAVAVLPDVAPLRYAAGVLSAAMAFSLLAATNLLWVLMLRHPNGVQSPIQLRAPAVVAAIAAAAEIGAIGVARLALTRALGLPF